ncbi:unnamed protein product, partial [Allacma fusca]
GIPDMTVFNKTVRLCHNTRIIR